ncbi:cyclic nucleotide-binding domain-containing protein [Desulfopila sp. IMCC35008]|uniref:cyclic nucleotide-binding domain-containing protein n=1 Tax=Desulfopila sp. IMCC35008 TaxID=2653858 RepID=UPI0013CFEE18|nr:cyclic nucleotide-binding domain-containing protein [Desulfopila sp. IMCC35008]
MSEAVTKTGHHNPEQKVVVMMTDMVGYSQLTSAMCPEELKNFIIAYHHSLRDIIVTPENQPVDLEPSAGDGALIVFKKNPGDTDATISTRAVQTAIKLASAISQNHIPPTRMGIFLGNIIEAELFGKTAKFSTCFAIANRLEELCGHFGTTMLMDREVARKQQGEDDYLVSIGKFSLSSVLHPMNAYSVYKPGINNCPIDTDEEKLREFIARKNEAMDHFSGNLLEGILPDFPKVRTKLVEAQAMFTELTGKEDKAIFRILEYIREIPYPDSSFNARGMMLTEKKRDTLGDRLYHLSKQLLKAMDYDVFHTLIEDTQWEQMFKLEWHNKGSAIINIGDPPDGIYYLDYGTAKTYNQAGELLSTMQGGDIFGEMAYFGNEQKRTATVIADSDVVVRRITTKNFRKLPIVIEIFRRIAEARKKELADETAGREKSN